MKEGGVAKRCSEGEPRRGGKAVEQPQQHETEGRGWDVGWEAERTRREGSEAGARRKGTGWEAN